MLLRRWTGDPPETLSGLTSNPLSLIYIYIYIYVYNHYIQLYLLRLSWEVLKGPPLRVNFENALWHLFAKLWPPTNKARECNKAMESQTTICQIDPLPWTLNSRRAMGPAQQARLPPSHSLIHRCNRPTIKTPTRASSQPASQPADRPASQPASQPTMRAGFMDTRGYAAPLQVALVHWTRSADRCRTFGWHYFRAPPASCWWQPSWPWAGYIIW